MNKNDRIIENINATMSMEDMELSQVDKNRLKECLEEKTSFKDEIDKLIKQYTRE